MGPKTWVALAIAAVVVIAVIAAVGGMWRSIGDVELGAGGWIALILGVVFALALGIGLMALLFISNRKGYDEPADWR